MRSAHELRPIQITRRFTETAAGSVLWQQGKTIVLCTASVTPEVPPWFGEKNVGGWLTAEYVMLPASTPQRKPWPRTGHTDSRGTEIQRLIGRSIRACIDLSKIGANTIHIDCQVLQADGGTRTASICGGYVALRDALASLPATPAPPRKPRVSDEPTATERAYAPRDALIGELSAVSVGIVDDQVVLDLDYALDSRAQVDLNVSCLNATHYVDVQGSAEQGGGFAHERLAEMLDLARSGCAKLVEIMRVR